MELKTSSEVKWTYVQTKGKQQSKTTLSGDPFTKTNAINHCVMDKQSDAYFDTFFKTEKTLFYKILDAILIYLSKKWGMFRK